jgi:hypothetical protein
MINENKVKPGRVFKKVECYSTNVGEMASELRKVLINPQTDEFNDIPLSTATKGVQAAYNQLRETILECEGKEFVIPLPSGTAGVVLNLLLISLGIDINAPIVIDSPVV